MFVCVVALFLLLANGLGGLRKGVKADNILLREIANNNSGWAFSGNVPMGAAGLAQNASRQLGGSVSFAQSLGGSQPATPLDLSYVLPCCCSY